MRSRLVHSSLSPVEFGRAPPLEDSRAEGTFPNWYKPISMENYQSITSSPTASTVLVTPTKPSKPCILAVVFVLSFDTDPSNNRTSREATKLNPKIVGSCTTTSFFIHNMFEVQLCYCFLVIYRKCCDG
mmetsp:Transcript_22629/g.25266  ORF Transcript_22629/g.25266 Transcript_22629/m.25266 type:complete len:129 (-) Transcript_22629:26-412(-)